MDILLYLTELLQTRKAIGILGLGTLYKKKSPGKYNPAKHAFVPPSYAIAFTNDIKEQDELANYISQKRNITTNAAIYFIGEFAEQIQMQLTEKQEADLEPIGKLKVINDEILLFPTQGDSFGFEFYGLPEISEATKTDEVIETTTSQTEENKIEQKNKLEKENPSLETVEENILANDEQEVYEEIAEIPVQEKTHHHLIENAPVIETIKEQEIEEPIEEVVATQQQYIEEEEPKKGMPFFMKFLISCLIIIALGAIVYFVNPHFFNNYFSKNSVGQPDKNIPILTHDSLKTKIDSPKTDSLAKNNSLVTLEKDSTIAIDSSKVIIFEVLVSAVSTEKKANKIIANLTNKGVTAKKIKLSKTMINISAGSFLKEETAKKYRDSLRIVLKNQGIYIQPIKPKK